MVSVKREDEGDPIIFHLNPNGFAADLSFLERELVCLGRSKAPRNLVALLFQDHNSHVLARPATGGQHVKRTEPLPRGVLFSVASGQNSDNDERDTPDCAMNLHERLRPSELWTARRWWRRRRSSL